MEALTFPIVMPGTQGGQKENYPQEFLPDAISPLISNMEFYNNRLQSKYGLSKMLATALNGYVLTKATLIKQDLTRYDVFATPTDVYQLDLANSRFTILTPTYTTGTIEVQVGTPTILRGTATLWAANIKPGDYIKIGAGNINTAAAWYKVTVVTDNTHLTVASAMPTTGAGSAYVARQTLTGGNTDYFDWVQFVDKNLGRILIMTNGADKPFYWTGSGQIVFFNSLPASLTAAKYCSVAYERLILGWTTEGGQNQPQRIQGSLPADITSWDANAFPIDFVDEPTEIKGMAKLGSYHVVFKETNSYIGTYVGGDFIISYNLSFQCKGVRSAYSIVVKQDFIYYYGNDKKFKRFNLLQEDNLSENNFPDTVQFDQNMDSFIQGYDVLRKNQIRWLCPKGSTSKFNYIYVHDYLFNVGLPWTIANANGASCIGDILRESDLYCDDPTLAAVYCDGYPIYCDDITLLDNGPLIICGGYDGYVRFADNGIDDDGFSFTSSVRLKRLNFNMPNNIKRLNRIQIWLESAVSGSVTCQIMKNDSTSFEAGSKVISLIPDSSDQDVVKRNVTFDMQGQDFQLEIDGSNYFAILGCIFFYYKKRSTKVQ